MSTGFEVVIIGAGHNGLVAGAYLARQGRKVTIVERCAAPGGLSTSGHLLAQAPRHTINAGAGELIHIRGTTIIQDLELERHGLRTVETDPTYCYLAPNGESIALFRDSQRTADDIARHNRADGAAYRELMQLIDALYEIASPMLRTDPAKPELGALFRAIGASVRHRKLKRQMTALASSSADQTACERFTHPFTQAFMLGIVAGAGPIDVDGHAVAYLLFGLLHRLGAAKPIGGMQTLIDALTASYAEAGGELILNAPATEIMIEEGKVKGVRLADGRVIAAKAVVATCDPRKTFQLTTPGAVDPILMRRAEHTPAYRLNAGPALLNVAMSKPLALKRHQELRRDGVDLNRAVALIGSAETVRESFAASRCGDIPAQPCFSVSPVTNWDPSQAPEGQSVAYIYLPATPVRARDNWASKQQLADWVLREAGEYFHGFDAELGRLFETCEERAVRANVTNGCVTHVDFSPYRSGAMRPAAGLGGPEAGARGFFLGGAGSHPGGGVSGNPGKIAAGRVQTYLKQTAR